MEAGRELDALVAEKVMAWDGIHRILNTGGDDYYWCCLACKKNNSGYELVSEFASEVKQNSPCPGPYYSTSISAAWEVVEKMQNNSYWWYVEVSCHHAKWYVLSNLQAHGSGVEAATAPLAICLAALKAKGVDL